MKKLVIMIAMVLLYTLSSPFPLLAEENADKNSETPEELPETDAENTDNGIEIYGEDISELTDEELQYIPKNWRDGNFESEHKRETQPKATLKLAYPDVNDYIQSKNLSVARVELDHKSEFPKFSYRFGYGRVEGVVAHETANNSSTLTGEINHMTNNYNNAFVHAFVDDSRIIEIHPTNYAAWGAGRFANERFVHVELVRVHSFEEFASSINNYASYIASLLYKYNLGVIDAERTGLGTLWSHKAVSIHLGGTTHVDPHGYFARWGYNWDDFVQLVKLKYNDYVTTPDTHSTSKLGHIESDSVRIYNDLSDLDQYSTAGSEYTNEVFYIKKQADFNGKVYYLISREPSSKTGTAGWVEADDMNVHEHTGVDKKKKNYTIIGSGKAYNKAWGGNKNLVYNNLSSYAGSTFKINLTEKVGNNIWYRGILGGKEVWIHSSYIMGFTDVKEGSSHYNGIYALVDMGAIRGYTLENGTKEYRPSVKITRSQAAVMFTKALDLPIPNNVDEVLNHYSDVDGSHYYADAIAATYQAGIFKGSNGKFMDGPLTREQMATVIAKAYDLRDTGTNTGIKLDNVSPSHRESVSLLAQSGITNQLADFRPKETVTRGQFATFLHLAIQQQNK
ncbi:S-layer homology domain-containing protein [Lentibacillus sp. Marseille-P4043]|uniref:S-layer homology domain-containing protein n=1 Tax=Lentibacillus sp. Marseille-P4043 TaxID=2040293 RepID=UPI000D0B6344|nr:S-layer homology domain-containing protein [Lentibacillus sp. Marseille-P4043]